MDVGEQSNREACGATFAWLTAGIGSIRLEFLCLCAFGCGFPLRLTCMGVELVDVSPECAANAVDCSYAVGVPVELGHERAAVAVA
jgi:hypothetical protein